MEDISSYPKPPPIPPRSNLRSVHIPTLPANPNPSPDPQNGIQTVNTVANTKETSFTPCYMFFYGSLMGPSVLRTVLNLSYTPTLTPAKSTGFTMRIWSVYPTLIPNSLKSKNEISGRIWKIEESHFRRLEEYETDAYTWCFCDVTLENGEAVKGCRTFCRAGDENSSDLEDGDF